MGLGVGDRVPSFLATKDNGEDFHSHEIFGKQAVVVYFYPKNFTPGCTKEACEFRDSYEDFKNMGAEVIGISSDSIKSHQRFKNKYNIPFVFLSDSDNKLRKLFGVKPSLFGVLPGRETYVVDKDGLIRLKFNSMNASKHLQNAFRTLKNLTNE